ncbi:MAG: phage minor head protein, partial [Phenylobacterium sp.]|nr:phage minor head protein [Phenylobacterium sp.]
MADPRFAFPAEADPRAVGFLEGKGLKRSWRWASMWRTEHAYAFTLAGVYRLDVLAETKALVTEAIAQGQTVEQFRAALRPKLESLGFAGPQVVNDFQDGPRKVDLTAPWRIRTIYDTNIRQAYAAAEWQGIEDTAADFPAIQYHHTPQQHPRLQHQAWDKIVLPVSHPFWRTNFPPNGWFCKCFTIQVSVDELASGAVTLTSDETLRGTGYTPDKRFWREWRHRETGRTDIAPEGVTPAFAYNAGQERRRNLGELLARRVEALDPDMARAASADLVNFPLFADLVDDAVRLGQARAAAQRAVVARLAGG